MLAGVYSSTTAVARWLGEDFEVEAVDAQSKERAPSKLMKMKMERVRKPTWVS